METTANLVSIVIAEDDVRDAQVLKNILINMADVTIEGTASNGALAVELVKQQQPTAVFLDVEMPEMDGLAAAHIIRELCPEIFIVFVTAHVEYAAAAFEVEAVGYLIKPVNHDSVHRIIQKIRKYSSYSKHMAHNNSKVIAVKNRHETYIIDVSRILFIERSERKTVIHTREKIYSTLESLSSLEKKIDSRLWRCHKSYIVNIKELDAIRPIADRMYEISFVNYPFTVSTTRNKLNEFYANLNLEKR